MKIQKMQFQALEYETERSFQKKELLLFNSEPPLSSEVFQVVPKLEPAASNPTSQTRAGEINMLSVIKAVDQEDNSIITPFILLASLLFYPHFSLHPSQPHATPSSLEKERREVVFLFVFFILIGLTGISKINKLKRKQKKHLYSIC